MIKTIFTISSILLIESFVFSQCLPFSGTILPKADTSKIDNFGSDMAIYKDILVVGASNHDSLEYDAGIVYVYKRDSNQKWNKIASLYPSDAQPYMGFGYRIAIIENTIVIGLHIGFYKDQISIAKLYVFEKEIGSQWVSMSESYQIVSSNEPNSSTFLDFDISEEYLAVGYIGSERAINVYKKQSKTYSLETQLKSPYIDYDAQTNFGDGVAISSNLIVITDPYYLSNGKQGIGLLYEKNNDSWNLQPSAYLRPSSFGTTQDPGFALNVDIDNNTVFIGAARYPISDSESTIAGFVYEKPQSGWEDMTENAKLIVAKESNAFFHSTQNLKIKAFKDYVILSNYRRTKEVFIFKKKGELWQNQSEENFIESPYENDPRLFGYNVAINEEHLFISSPELENGLVEQIYQYNYSGSDLEHKVSPDFIIENLTVNSAGDRFGNDISVNGNTIVVGVNSDTNQGAFSGSVAIYEFDGFNWNKTHNIKSPFHQAFENFGISTDISDNFLFVSSTHSDSLDSDGKVLLHNIGRVYVFEKINNTWKYSSTILSPNVQREVQFGRKIYHNNGYVAISEFGVNFPMNNGAVYIYKLNLRNKWDAIATLTPSVTINEFGNSITMNDNEIVIGSSKITFNSDQASVYVFSKKNEWADAHENATLSLSEVNIFDSYGFDIDMNDEYIVVGSPFFSNTKRLYRFGKVYVFKKPINGWVGDVLEIATLEPKQPITESFFGYTVTIDNHSIKVGAPHSIIDNNRIGVENNSLKNIQPGRAYVFFKRGEEWESGTEDKMFMSPNPEPLDGFGYAIASFNGHFLVSSLMDDTDVGKQSGAVHTYYDLPYIITRDTFLCSQSDILKLEGFPTGGNFIGNGVDNNFFNPILAGPGIHTLNYQVEDCTNLPFLIIEVMKDLPKLKILKDSLYICQAMEGIVIEHSYSNIDTLINWYYSKDNINFNELTTTTGSSLFADEEGYYKASVSDLCNSFEDVIKIKEEIISVSDDIEVCDDQGNVRLQDFHPLDGVWTGTALDESLNIDLSQLSTGNNQYKYEVDRINCTFRDSLTINVHRILDPIFKPNEKKYIICESDNFEISVVNFNSEIKNNWKFSEDGTDFSTIENKESNVLIPTEKGFYKLSITDGYCSDDSDIFEIGYLTSGSITMPNAFSPNDDGINDTFRFKNEDITLIELVVIDRNGLRVFESNDLANEWSGINQPSGIYYYFLSYYSNCNTSEVSKIKGVINLLR